MFRRSVPERYALLFEFSRPATRSLHMVFVPFPIDAIWLIAGRVERVERLRPWLGIAGARADRILELPAGAADDVTVGDRVGIIE